MSILDLAPSLASAALAAGAATVVIHALYRLGEGLERRGVFPTRDFVMVPGLFAFLIVCAPAIDWLRVHAPTAFAPTAAALLLGMRFGQALPRPPHAGRRDMSHHTVRPSFPAGLEP